MDNTPEIETSIDLETRADCMAYAERLRDKGLMTLYEETVIELLTIAMNQNYHKNKPVEENFTHAYISLVREIEVPRFN